VLVGVFLDIRPFRLLHEACATSLLVGVQSLNREVFQLLPLNTVDSPSMSSGCAESSPLVCACRSFFRYRAFPPASGSLRDITACRSPVTE
jgi:hypothetical protein